MIIYKSTENRNTSGPDRSSWPKVRLTGNPGLNIKSLSDANLRDKVLFKPATPFPECFWDCEINHHDPFVISMINKHKLGILPEGYVRDLASEMKMEAPIEHEHLSISTDLIKWALPITVTIPEGSLTTNIQITTKARSSIFGATPEESTLHALYSTPNKEIYIVDPNTNEIQLYTKANQFETELARLNNQYNQEQTQIAKELREGELQAKGSKEQQLAKTNGGRAELPCNLIGTNTPKSNTTIASGNPYSTLQELRRKYLNKPLDIALGLVEESEAYSCQPEFYVKGQKVTKQEAIEAQKTNPNTEVDIYTAKNKLTVEKGLEDEGFLKDLEKKALEEYKEVRKAMESKGVKPEDLDKVMQEVGNSPELNRDDLMGKVQDERLRKIINELYRELPDVEKIGNGGSADMLRTEKIENNSFKGTHSQKVDDAFKRLTSIKKEGGLSEDESKTLDKLIDDLRNTKGLNREYKK